MSNKEKLLASAQKNLQKGQIGKAVKDYQKLVDADPKDMRNRQKLAELLSRTGMGAEALTQYQAVADSYAGNGFYLKAIAVYKQMQRLDPNEKDYYLRLAELNEKQGLVGNAQAEYRSLVALYEKDGLVSEKIDVLEKMKALEPDNLSIRVKIVETCLEASLQERAGEEFGEILETLSQKKDYAKITKLFEMFPSSFAENPDSKRAFARALVEMGDTERAVPLLEGLLREQGEDPDSLKILARGYQKDGNLDPARSTLERFRTCCPQDSEPLENHIRCCLDEKEFSGALDATEAWGETILAAGRDEALRAFYEELASALPGEKRVADLQKGVIGLPPEPAGPLDDVPGPNDGASAEPEEAEAVLELPLEEALADLGFEEAPSEPPPGDSQSESAEAGEIPLDFLEGVGAAESVQLDQEPETAQEEEPVPESPFEPGPEASGMEEPPGEGDEFIELELSVDPLEEVLATDLDLSEALVSGEEQDSDVCDGELLELDGVLSAATGPDAGALSGADLKAELEEAEFYLQQGLIEEAGNVCRRVLEGAPDCSEARRMLDELASRHPNTSPSPTGEKEGVLVPGGEAPEEVLSSPPTGSDPAGAGDSDPFDFGESITDSQRGVETEVALEDTETHYNLGIAYKEMGLLDDAVAEFERAGNDPARRVACLTLKGICLTEKGAFAEAEAAFDSGLDSPDLAAAEKVGLDYEAGLLYQAWDRPREALERFRRVAEMDLFYRDVGQKIEALSEALGLEKTEDDDTRADKEKKNRVSYV